MVVSVKKFCARNQHFYKVFFIILTFFLITFYSSWPLKMEINKYMDGFSLQDLTKLIDAIKPNETTKANKTTTLNESTKLNDTIVQHKMIFLWNSPERIEAAIFGTGHQAFVDAKCPVNNCTILATSDKIWNKGKPIDLSLLETFDAVVISLHELWKTSMPPPQYKRPARQRFVLFTQESPQSMIYFKPEEFDNVFNWTMSYKQDSDIKLFYGRTHPIVENGTNQIPYVHQRNRNKTKKVAWMVSHCQTPSQREEYVKELKKHIQVDIYGGCGELKCARNDTHWLSQPECYVKLSNEYKFYLSFENSICKDYVTEKFFNILKFDMVPVVLGGADYKSLAPPHSFIDSAHFKTPADLAAYLLYLDGNDELYESYFDWRTQFSVETGVEKMSRHAFCDLCAKLNQPKEPPKMYVSLMPQWSIATQCNNSRPLKLQ